MARIPLYQLDAFTDRLFGGNPAAVMLLEAFPADAVLQALAAENNLAETAFLVREAEGWRLRWFTPRVEVPLCGHATLASAAVVLERLEPNLEQVVFQSASGPLTVRRLGDGYELDFPARPSEAISVPAVLAAALGAEPAEVWLNGFNYMAVFEDAATVRALAPDMAALAALDRPGVIATAPGEDGYDMLSRYFAPAKGIPEDPVTGAAHCMLAPYWAARLGKSVLKGFQASERGGEMTCRLEGDRVRLQGRCVFYLEGWVAL